MGSTDALLTDAEFAQDRYTYRAFGLATHTGTPQCGTFLLHAGLPRVLGSVTSVGSSTSAGSEYNFVGRQGYFQDLETGLYWLRKRPYDPTTAQFTCEDPKGYDPDVNMYRYCGNNPVNATDPSGEETGPLFATTSAVIAALKEKLPPVLAWNADRRRWEEAPWEIALAVNAGRTIYTDTGRPPKRFGPSASFNRVDRDPNRPGDYTEYRWDANLRLWYEVPLRGTSEGSLVAAWDKSPSDPTQENSLTDDQIIDFRIRQILRGQHPAIKPDKLPQILAGVLPGAVDEAAKILRGLAHLDKEIEDKVKQLVGQVNAFVKDYPTQLQRGEGIDASTVRTALERWATASVADRKHRLAMVLNITDAKKIGELLGATATDAGTGIAAGVVVKLFQDELQFHQGAGAKKPATGTQPEGMPGAESRSKGVPNKGTTRYHQLLNKENRLKNELAAGGNRGVAGTVNKAEANFLGERFVGERFSERRGPNGERILISEDGRRQYRGPTSKLSPHATTGQQANFETRPAPQGRWENNVHFNIED